MKIKFIILFFFVSIVLNATNYYVSVTDGNDSDSGLTPALAWKTITKVNTITFVAGDSILFNKGDRFVGRLIPKGSGILTDYIVFSSYGTGDDPIVTPVDTISGLAWTSYGDGIYYTTGIPYNPGNILINGVTKINKINDAYIETGGAYYSGFNAMQLLALAEDYEFTIEGNTFYFWDGLDALYAYDGDTTFIRFRGGENPNDSVLYVAEEDCRAIYIYNKRYLKFRNLQIIGGEFGFQISTINYDGTENIIIENCDLRSSNRKVYITYNSKGIIVRNSTITNDYLSPYTPGAYDHSSEYTHEVRYHIYRFFKNVIGTGSSTQADQAISFDSSSHSYCTFNDNTVTYCVNGISAGGNNNNIYNNYIEGVSSVAIQFGEHSDGSQAYNNYFIDVNFAFRFQGIDNTTYGTPRTNYIYNNRVFIPDAGNFMYIHFNVSGNASTTTAYLYHNSVICFDGIECSAYIDDNVAPSGFIFVNNIISASAYNSLGIPGVATKANCFVYYYNWTGGDFYNASGLPDNIALWATDASNQNFINDTYWDHSIDPPDFTNVQGKGTIDAGINISVPFTLGAVNYPALPGTFAYSGTPDIGYYEYESTIRRKVKNNGLKVRYGTKTVYY